jgi:hypothetical protein
VNAQDYTWFNGTTLDYGYRVRGAIRMVWST